MKNYQSPNYTKIYHDILDKKFPEKKEKCLPLLEKKRLTSRDVIKINTLIFGGERVLEVLGSNHKFRSYDQETIQYILEYQNKNKLNNTQVSIHFKMSRNTLAKWKKNMKPCSL